MLRISCFCLLLAAAAAQKTTVSTWADLAKGVASCKGNCSFELSASFTTPADGFKHIHIGDDKAKTDDDDDGGKVTQAVSIEGAATIDAHSQDRVFSVGKGSSLTISGGTTIQNGRHHGQDDNGGAIHSLGHLELTGVTFTKNSAAGYGGGAIVVGGGSATVSSCTFDTNDSGSEGGGAVYISNGASVAMTGCTFKSNYAGFGRQLSGGGAINVYGGSIIITTCTFDGNTAPEGGGGGAVIVSYGSATITGCTFTGKNGSHVDSIFNLGDGSSTTTFACPSTSSGAPVVISKQQELLVAQLPPAAAVAHCA